MVHLKVVGDMYFGGGLLDKGPAYCFEEIRDYLHADILAGNCECVLLPQGQEVDRDQYPKALFAYEDCADMLKETGFDIVWLANNHIMDLGDEGILSTKKIIESRGILAAGAGENPEQARELKIVEKEGIGIGFLAYAENCPQLWSRRRPGPAYNVFSEMKEDILKAKENVDVVAVIIHADVEFVDFPNIHRQEYSHKLAEAGADIIIEGHPHVPQGIEVYDGCLIAYCLGNFIFTLDDYQTNGSPWTSKSFILDISVSKQGAESYEVIPYRIEDGRPVVLEETGLDEFHNHFEQVCVDLLDPEKMKQHHTDTVKRYLQIHLNWLYGQYQKEGVDAVIEKFLPRYHMQEGEFIMRDLIEMAKEYVPEL
jgi:poly-gamma-glutamate synthesis protein (capsule biosynthesis protein)